MGMRSGWMLGVQKKKKPIKRFKKTLFKKVVDYLKSDSYLFDPLLSPMVVSSSSYSTCTTTAEMKENLKWKNMRSLLEKVGNYLRSDSYLYAPMIAPQQLIHSKAFCKHRNRVTVEVPVRKSIWKDNESTVGNITVEDQFTKSDLPEKSIPGEHKLVHRGTGKHELYQSCSSSAPGKGILNPQLRNITH